MPPRISEEELGNVILKSVEYGAYPESEHVASAELPPAALPNLLEVIGNARENVKSEIRVLSREVAPDIDGWIAQAKQLQADIERSRATAQEIVQQAESGKAQQARVEDAASKVRLLENELVFNETLVEIVEQIQTISELLENAQDAAVQDQVIQALDKLEEADEAMAHLGTFENTRVVGLLQSRANQLRAAIVENATECWNALLLTDSAEHRVTIKDEIQRQSPISIDSVIESLSKLRLLDTAIARLARDFDNIILAPRLSLGTDQVVAEVIIDGDYIEASGRLVDMSVTATLKDIHRVAEYLSTRLPPSIAVPLSEKLMPVIASRLISGWLLPSVPISIDGVKDFQEILSLVLGLAEYPDELGWSGQSCLVEWVDKSPEIWLARQKEAAIADIRALCFRSIQDKRVVERVETRMISKSDAIINESNQQDEDWGAAWGDDEEEQQIAEDPQSSGHEEEEDVSAWEVDDDEPQKDTTNELGNSIDSAAEDDTEAWGWGDEDDSHATPSNIQRTEPKKANGTGTATQGRPLERELTLKETYTVTAIPDAIIETIIKVVVDVDTLNQPALSKSVIAPASIELYTIPALVLAMYRATAATYYSKDEAGNMLIYNDCTRISDQIRSFLTEQAHKDQTSSLPLHLRPSARLKLDGDIKAIEGFGKRAYGREMESQRTIIKDLLDGAQGFANCTVPPFAAECDNAISMTADWIRKMHRQWKGILSRSALLQSLGSLVSTALNKMIVDIEDMSDIAEEESKRLRYFCDEMVKLSSLFVDEDPAGTSGDMISIYTPNWFKFQYLSEILESSLADIKYFWTEGELKLEMQAEEVVDLIKALFAESEHRRRAISEIRRTSVGR
ncbi:hypothetical protein K432DRAFT_446386 [Lepidopterella palustris CBS 459.81]|uniref:ZW10 C-terminal helical domain-containing protein n=1 Tax=Lepidopterella palustris CBS 459.81 TaxID=1314670 RepID=A0A8E2E275_9PEZI|nr:hypothetical protein K432DRAFT_446386 [Lepidopterella palustris CBS 459.81]